MSHPRSRFSHYSHKALPILLLILFLGSFLYYALNHYNCRTYSDPRIYLDAAKHLATGHAHIHYPPDKLLISLAPPEEITRGCTRHIIRNGKSFSFVSMGYPLVLAAMIRLFSTTAVFFLNTGIMLILFLSFWIFVTTLFRQQSNRYQVATTAVVLLFLLLKNEITVLLACYRDPLAHTLLLLGLTSFLKATRNTSARTYIWFALAGLFLGLSAFIRETNIIILAPLGITYLVYCFRPPFAPHIRRLGTMGIVLCIALTPWLAFNQLYSGNPFLPSQSYDASSSRPPEPFAGNPASLPYTSNGSSTDTTPASPPKQKNIVPGISFRSVGTVLHDLGMYVRSTYGWFVLTLMAMGVWLCHRRTKLEFLLLSSSMIIFIIFVSGYIYFMWRYFLVTHFFTLPLASLGAAYLLEKTNKSTPERRGLLVPAVSLALAIPLLLAMPDPNRFQINDARRFVDEAEEIMPANSLLIAERPIREMADYLTRSHSVNLEEWLRPELGITLTRAINHYRQTEGPVFFCDAPDTTFKHTFDRTPVTREQLLDYFDLQKAGTLQEYTVFEVTDWSTNRITTSVSWEQGAPALLEINARKLWTVNNKRQYATISLDEYDLGELEHDGINWIRLPNRLTETTTNATITITSDRPLPMDMGVTVIDWTSPYLMDIGAQAVPLDHSFLSKNFYAIPTFDSPDHRAIHGTGMISCPEPGLPNSHTLIKGLVRSADHSVLPSCDSFLIGGQEILFDTQVQPPDWDPFFLLLDSIPNLSMRQLTIQSEVPLEFGSLLVTSIPQTNAFNLNMADKRKALLLRGFHRLETDKTGVFRWSQPHAGITFPITPRQATEYELVLTSKKELLPHSLSHSLPSIQINGEPLYPTMNSSDNNDQHFRIPKNLLKANLNNLEIVCEGWNPGELLAIKDRRILGLPIQAIKIVPLDQSDQSSLLRTD